MVRHAARESRVPGVDSSGEGAQFWIRGLSFHPEDMLRPGNRGGAQTDPGTFDQEE